MVEKVKGFKDVLPEEALKREKIIGIVKDKFKLYGFLPLETPSIEKQELLNVEDVGEETISQTFKLKDRAGRQLGLIYELTTSLSRVITENPNIKMPFKRYQIAKVWRDEPTKIGRYREFTQADADIIGSAEILADAEILALTSDIFSELGINNIIEVNNRKLLNGLLDSIEIVNEKKKQVMVIVDKINKIGREETKKELIKIINKEQIKKLFSFFNKNLEELEKNKMNEEIKQGISELKQLFVYARNFKIKLEFVPYLVRGLGYYTGNVFEVFAKQGRLSLAAGGRYDEKLGKSLGRKIPTVGISFGIDRITEICKIKEEKKQVLILPITAIKEGIKLAQQLRKKGIATDLSYSGITKSLNYANSLKIPYVIFIGKKELEKKKVKLRDMKTGKEKLITLDKLIPLVQP